MGAHQRRWGKKPQNLDKNRRTSSDSVGCSSLHEPTLPHQDHFVSKLRERFDNPGLHLSYQHSPLGSASQLREDGEESPYSALGCWMDGEHSGVGCSKKTQRQAGGTVILEQSRRVFL